MDPGTWTTFHGAGAASILGTPWGRQFASGSSRECAPSTRESNSVLAHGWNGTSSGLRSAARFRTYFAPSGSQMPDRSGLPSVDLGAAAERSGWPLVVRGIPAWGILVHCADSGVDIGDIRDRATTRAPADTTGGAADSERLAFMDGCMPSSQLRDY